MPTIITPPTPITTLQEGCDWLRTVYSDLALSFTDTEFLIEILGRSYTIRRPLTHEDKRKIWFVTVTDNDLWPSRTGWSLGYFWHWEYAIDSVAEDFARFYPSPQTIDGGNLFLWLDASDEDTVVLETGTTDVVEQWTDKSVNGFDAVQTVSARRPRLIEGDLNSLNVISFDGLGQHFICPVTNFRDWAIFAVAQFVSSTNTDRGTFFAAMGLETPFSGADAYVLNSNTLGPEGTLQTYIEVQAGFLSSTATLVSGTYALIEYVQKGDLVANSEVGINGTIEALVDCGNTTDDTFDTRVLEGVDITPVTGAVGRTNAGSDPGFDYNYLEGKIAELVLYNRKLTDPERALVRLGLQSKWQV